MPHLPASHLSFSFDFSSLFPPTRLLSPLVRLLPLLLSSASSSRTSRPLALLLQFLLLLGRQPPPSSQLCRLAGGLPPRAISTRAEPAPFLLFPPPLTACNSCCVPSAPAVVRRRSSSPMPSASAGPLPGRCPPPARLPEPPKPAAPLLCLFFPSPVSRRFWPCHLSHRSTPSASQHPTTTAVLHPAAGTRHNSREATVPPSCGSQLGPNRLGRDPFPDRLASPNRRHSCICLAVTVATTTPPSLNGGSRR
ncbi:hypothetical protein BT93_H3149 [Corymbia citriodora subsp. variegata]|nr:hypothetical protein BT93_H3149 [Corymbia citriodora subsp. variegata]